MKKHIHGGSFNDSNMSVDYGSGRKRLTYAQRKKLFQDGHEAVMAALHSFLEQRDAGRSASMNSGLDGFAYAVSNIIKATEQALG